ncbi:MAG: hypothetical protein EOP88_17760 [Verrucomicrobiaceae bacterium]|nr:MAG: hypothetical protein EOP88_17760 [Verrucomicrobiaceae bacterium]
MKRLLSRCLVPFSMATALPLLFAHAEEPVPPAKDATAAKASFTDPKAAYRSYIEAIRAMDLTAALKCWSYEPEQEEAMKVVAGVWISHRRFEKAVDAVPEIKAEKKILEGYIRPDVTDKALDAAVAILSTAEVKENGGMAELLIKWDDKPQGSPDPEEIFLSGNQPAFVKADGGWKLTPVSDQGNLLGDGDFFAEGGWGRMLRDGVAMLDEASGKLEKGEIKTFAGLKALMGEREKAMKERNEQEKQNLKANEKPRPQ